MRNHYSLLLKRYVLGRRVSLDISFFSNNENIDYRNTGSIPVHVERHVVFNDFQSIGR